MPVITERRDYNGFVSRVERLGLAALVTEVEAAVTGFRLEVREDRHANGTRQIRQAIDGRFETIGGWTKTTVGGVDWTKANNRRSTLGVEIQVSGRSDLLAVDVLHLREQLTGGNMDAGIIVVPDNRLSRFLTDRTPNLNAAVRHVESRAPDMALHIIAFRHDGAGEAIPKAITNLGRVNRAQA